MRVNLHFNINEQNFCLNREIFIFSIEVDEHCTTAVIIVDKIISTFHLIFVADRFSCTSKVSTKNKRRSSNSQDKRLISYYEESLY